MRRMLIALGLTLALGLGGAACSSGSKHLSQAEFSKQGNAICDDYSQRLIGVIPSSEKLGTTPPEQLAPAFSKFASIGDDGNNKLKELKPPKDAEASFDKAIALQTAQVADVRSIAASLAKGQALRNADLTKVDKEGDAINPFFDKIGLRHCGSDASE